MNIELSGNNSFEYKGFDVLISTKDEYCGHYFNGSTLDIDVDGEYEDEYHFSNFDNLKEAIEWVDMLVDEVVKDVLEFGVLADE